MFKRVSGTKDILPEEVSRWQEIEKQGRNILSLYNYQEIRLPLIEEAALFGRSLGESAEIVQKQMFLIKKDKDTYSLRPEGTASVARAYIENNLYKKDGFIKLYYIGPMFRAERPQKGRLRQFHHLGCEAIGSADTGVDVELISLADTLLKSFSISGYDIQLNSLGCPQDKKRLIESLRRDLKAKVNKLCPDCRVRFKKNVLRVLDCKNESCREIVSSLNIQAGHLCADCGAHFNKVREGLDALRIDYRINPYLVRGLDYYTRTVFEVIHPELGSQDALGAGGRYDGLIPELGGPEVGAMGFAFGIERLLLAATPSLVKESAPLVFIISLGGEARKESLRLLDSLRKKGIRSDTDYENRSLKAAMRKANDSSARFVLIIGDDELKNKTVALKDMDSGEQRAVKEEDLVKELTAGA
jgi:histidyl-tRNA synthetase